MSRVRDEATRGLRRVRAKAVKEADRFVTRAIPDFARLASLTPIAASRQAPTMLFHTSDLEMGPHIWSESGYEDDGLEWVLEYLGNPQSGHTVVEIGANVGTTTVPLLTRFGARHVEAFEPSPDNVKLLRCNLILNDVDRAVTLQAIALSDADGISQMELCASNSGDHRIKAVDSSWEVLGESEWRTLAVKSLRLDGCLKSAPNDVALVWVDTQGHEGHVMAGASSLLGNDIPWVIEYWPYALTRAGGLGLLNELIAENFTSAVDVRASQKAGRVVALDPGDLPALAASLGVWYTDLILTAR